MNLSRHNSRKSFRQPRRRFARNCSAVMMMMIGLLLTGMPTAFAVTANPAPDDATEATAGKSPKPTLFEGMVAKIVAQLISTQHYTLRKLDDQVSAELFDEFFNTLDRERKFFLAADLADFSEYRTQLDDMLLKGDTSFAYDVYRRLLERVRERTEFAKTQLQAAFDLNVDEEIQIDRSKAEWAASAEELDDIWRRLLKNRIVLYTLGAEAAATAEKKPPPSTAAPEIDDQDADAQPPPEANTPEPAEDTLPHAEADAVTPPIPPAERTLRFFERYLKFLEENESMDVLELYLSSLTRIYDPHSAYMAPSTEEDFDINMSLSLEGIGAVLTTEDGYTKIVSIVPGGPADLDGRLHEGDRIVAVAQENSEPVDIIDMPLRKAVRQIRGPKGSKVLLSIIRAGKSLGSMPIPIEIVRDEVKLTDQGAKAEIETRARPGKTDDPEMNQEAQIMILTLPSFYSDFTGKRKGDAEYSSSSRDVRKLLKEATEKNVDGLILDLRSNGGGSLEEAIEIAGMFFAKGPVVQVRSSGNRRNVYSDTDNEILYRGPLVLLVNRLSASASEIVAAALQDYGRGVIVGDKSTHGKGTVQTVLELNRFFERHPLFATEQSGSLKFTIAKFYRVSGGSVQRTGVIPDVSFPAFTDHMELGEASLEHAMLWDQIEPVKVKSPVDVKPYLATIKAQSEQRLTENPEFLKLQEAIASYGEITARKKLPLNIDKRRDIQKEEERWAEKVRRETIRREVPTEKIDETPQATPDKTKTEEQPKPQDLVLDEALNIMLDLIQLQEHQLLAEQPQNK